MKRALLILLAIAALLSGCAAASVVSRDEGLNGSFAYVLGGIASGQSMHFSLNGNSDPFDSHSSFSVNGFDSYALQKVHPGRYTASSASLSGERRLSNSQAPLATVDLEAGKITYIGDIEFLINAVSGPGYVPKGAPGFPQGRVEGNPQISP